MTHKEIAAQARKPYADAINKLQRDHDALLADRDRLRDALADLSAWFRPVTGALTARELLMGGCPNDLEATIDRAHAALSASEGGERIPKRCGCEDDRGYQCDGEAGHIGACEYGSDGVE